MFFLYFHFRLFTFPSCKDAEKRVIWRKLINRREMKNPCKVWSPRKQSRVCSIHFKDRMSSETNPHPTENLGYDSASVIRNVLGCRRKLDYKLYDNSTSDTNNEIFNDELVGANIEILESPEKEKQTLPNNFFFKTKSYVIYPIPYASKIVLLFIIVIVVLTVLIAVATLLAFGAYQAMLL